MCGGGRWSLWEQPGEGPGGAPDTASWCCGRTRVWTTPPSLPTPAPLHTDQLKAKSALPQLGLSPYETQWTSLCLRFQAFVRPPWENAER